jgi:hypothetical protein
LTPVDAVTRPTSDTIYYITKRNANTVNKFHATFAPRLSREKARPLGRALSRSFGSPRRHF